MTDETLNSEAQPTEPSPEATEDDAMGAAYDKLMRDHGAERGPDGKFVSPKGEAEPEGEPEPEEGAEAEPVEAEAEGEQETEPEASEEAGPPEHLPQAVKAAWKDLPVETRDAIAKHQADVDRKFSQQGRLLQAVQPIADRLTQAVQQYPQFLQLTPEELAEGAIRLAAVQHDLENDPVNTVLRVAQEYGVLEHLRAYMQGQQPTEQSNYIAQLQREIRDLKSAVEKGQDSVDEKITAAMSQRETARLVAEFRAERPHFAEVEPYLPHFIATAWEQAPEASPEDVLSAAYDMATNAIPEVRAKIAKGAVEAPKADPERAAKAKRAASVNLKSTSSGKERARTEEELLGDAYDRMMAG